MTNAITVSTESEFGVMMQQADALVKSGFLPNSVRTPQQAVAIMMMGRELEIGPWAAINGINVIQGKPTISPQLMLALINRSGELADLVIDGDTNACTVTMTRKGRSPHTETFTMDMARAMGLAGRDNWKKQPETMLKWRAVSACARVVFPDVIIGFYTPEEIDPDVTVDMETGEIVERPAAPPPPAPDRNGKSAPDAVEGEAVKDHWINDPKVRARFWAYAKKDLKLAEAQVHEALGVESVAEFDGTMREAKDRLDVYADELTSRKPKPTQPEAPEPPPWDKGHTNPLFPEVEPLD